ncbi:MAG: efflux RND transporter permease subunit, partial [Planctomycetota bacterium]|nr:efflux RND transporter permease subunit [Planctomycetota bacterium]
MNPVIAWFARHGVAANLLMILILVGGSLTLPGIKEEIFPELPTNLILVSVEYLGASPEEVEEAVCMRVEEAILGITGIKRLRSTAREGVGAVFVEVLTGADSRQVLDEVKARVDAIDTFPEETERPQVQEHLFRRQVINVAVSGDTDERSLRVVAEQVRDELSRLPEISLVQLANARPYEISVEVPEEALRRYGLTFDHVARAVRSSSLDLPGGSVKTRGGEILVRTKGQAYRGREFEDIILISRNDGSRLRLGDVARVIDGFADTDQIVRFGGKPAILVQVFRVGQQGALAIADAVRDYISEAQRRLPEGITLTAWQDDSKVLRSRLDLMLRNGRVGLILVFASLALFLRLKLSFWVALGIPISFLGAVWILPLLGVSLNLISLFAFIVALGIVVDDAIIIGENVYTHIQQGGSGVDAATAGAQEMSTPVIFAILTTVAAFSPLVLVPGRYGEIMRVIPLVVIATLAFSLIESLLILPHHLAHFKSPDEERPGPVARGWRAFQGLFTGLLDRFIRRVYRPFLDGAIRWRYVTVTTGVGLLLLTGGMVFAGWIKFTFFPQVDADNVVAFLTMPQGAPLGVTEGAVRKIEKAAEELRAEINREGVSEIDDIYLHSLTSIGGQPFREAQNQNRGQLASFSGGHLAEINIELIPSEERSISSADVANRWRRKVGSVADAVELTFSSSIFASGDDVNVQLSSPHLDDLRQAAAELKRHLATYTGVHDIADSFRAGKQELKLSIKPAAENLGLTLADLARQV